MKIYVDGEMPKSCGGCLFQDYETNACCMNDSISCHWKDGKKAKNCPLHPVAEREAEVRKEVVEEIYNLVEKHKGTIHYRWVIEYSTMKNILDQVERREDDVKD